MRTFGISMEGCELGLEAAILSSIAKAGRNADEPFRFQYLEIGVAWAQTFMQAINIIMDEHASLPDPNKMIWSATGIDLPGGRWCLGPEKFYEWCQRPFRFVEEPPFGYPQRNGAVVVLADATPFLRHLWRYPINFALIDGCHTKECAKAEFEAIEPWVVPGGTVVFHDAALDDQVERDHDPIQVFAALNALNLIGEDSPRKGWVGPDWIKGDKSRGGNSCAVFWKMGG